ncbi:MAG: DUF6273 domain-containing protein [Christensenellales bacterium]
MLDNNNPYDTQAGFLTSFSANMHAALLDTTLAAAKATLDGGGSESDKIFLLSRTARIPTQTSPQRKTGTGVCALQARGTRTA